MDAGTVVKGHRAWISAARQGNRISICAGLVIGGYCSDCFGLGHQSKCVRFSGLDDAW